MMRGSSECSYGPRCTYPGTWGVEILVLVDIGGGCDEVEYHDACDTLTRDLSPSR